MSLTPHEDAARAAVAQSPRYDDPRQAASGRVINAAMIEMAQLVDMGHSQAPFSVVVDVAVSLIKTIARSAGDEPRDQARIAGVLLGAILDGFDSSPTWQHSEPVRGRPPGRA